MKRRTCIGKLFQVLILACAVAACAHRPGSDVLVPVEQSGSETVVEVFSATNRASRSDAPGVFGTNRAARISWEVFSVSIPPRHEAGNIEWPMGEPDPSKSFAIVGRDELTAEAFVNRITAGHRRRDVSVFVHGYNTRFQEGLFRQAQMAADGDRDMAAILFSWPSTGTLRGYAADREAATFSRDHLVDLLAGLARDDRIGNIMVLGHSMGGWLTMEALRQLRQTGQHRVIDRLEVILAAPDIDIDVFRAQVQAIGALDPPLIVLVSTDDAALRMSRRVNADRLRIGAIDVSDPEVAAAVAGGDVMFVDISEIQAPDLARHGRYAMLSALYPQLEPYAGNTVRNAGAYALQRVGDTLASPFVLIAGALGGG